MTDQAETTIIHGLATYPRRSPCRSTPKPTRGTYQMRPIHYYIIILICAVFLLPGCEIKDSRTPTQPVDEPAPRVPTNNASVTVNDSGIIPTGGQGSASFVVSVDTAAPANEFARWEFQEGNPPSSAASQGKVFYSEPGTFRWTCRVCNVNGCSEPREGFVTFVDEATAIKSGSGF